MVTLSYLMSQKQIGWKKKVGKNYWSTKVLVTCTQFSHFLPTKFT